MKNLIIIILIALASFTSSCGLKEVIGPDGGGISTSDSYQPIAKGNTWKYTVSVIGQTGTTPINMVMTGDTKSLNGKTYYKAIESTDTDTQVGFFSHSGSVYTNRIEDPDPDETLEEPYLNDALAVGATFTAPANDTGMDHGVQERYLLTMVEKGISKTVNGKTFQNVIHTRSEQQVEIGGGFQTYATNDYYVAKGVGVIEIDASIAGQVIAKQMITSYNLK